MPVPGPTEHDMIPDTLSRPASFTEPRLSLLMGAIREMRAQREDGIRVSSRYSVLSMQADQLVALVLELEERLGGTVFPHDVVRHHLDQATR